MKIIRPEITHECNTCGSSHTKIPQDARPQKDFDGVEIIGYYWECSCSSTMFILIKPIEEYEEL